MARGTIITRVSKDGTKRYATVLRINGRQQWRTWDKKREAEHYLDNLSPDVRDHTYREIKPATFKEYVDHWQETELIPQNFKPSTYGGYRSVIEHHLLPEFKNYPIGAISSAEINSFKAKLLKADLNGKTVRNVLILLGKILEQAVNEDYLRRSPMKAVELPKIDKEQKGRTLKPDEIRSILKACDGDIHTMVATAIATGMRRSEQFALDWENVDWEKNTISVRRALYWKYGKYHGKQKGERSYTFTAPKSKKSIRDIDISPELRKELRELYLKGGRKGLIFCTSNGTPYSPENIAKRSFGEVLIRAEAQRVKDGIPPIGHVRWHDLRHTFGSLKIHQGEKIYDVMRWMGHSSIEVTIGIYCHEIESRNPEAAAKTDAMIFGS
jgi:integrase